MKQAVVSIDLSAIFKEKALADLARESLTTGATVGELIEQKLGVVVQPRAGKSQATKGPYKRRKKRYSQLDPALVHKVRAVLTERPLASQVSIANEFKTSDKAVSNIVHGRCWVDDGKAARGKEGYITLDEHEQWARRLKMARNRAAEARDHVAKRY